MVVKERTNALHVKLPEKVDERWRWDVGWTMQGKILPVVKGVVSGWGGGGGGGG